MPPGPKRRLPNRPGTRETDGHVTGDRVTGTNATSNRVISSRMTSVGIVCAGVIAAVALATVFPAQAEPDIDDVRVRVEGLYREAEVAQERYNGARIQLRELRREVAALKSDEQSQQQRLDVARAEVSDAITRQYQGEGVSTIGNVIVSDDPSAFLGQLSTMSAYTDIQSGLFESYSAEVEALQLRSAATAQRTDEIAETAAQLERDSAELDDKLAQAEDLLDDLEAEERARIARARDAETMPTPVSSVPPSGRAAAAVQYALDQVGDAYVYGAAGPDAFDCSGLTMSAWAAAGVALPHQSGAQASSGTPVSQSDLQPGDLIFFYSPISHVGIYIGNGQMVDAANPSTGVRVTSISSMPYAGAVRPG